jgi:hypothetical protein
MKILLALLLRLPSFPIAFALAVYFVLKDLKDKGWERFILESDDESISTCKTFCDKYYINAILYAIDTIGWFYILKYFFF